MKRSKHSLSHYRLLTADQGELIPCALTEVLPGDTIQQATSALVRVSPLVAPVMHPVNVRIHHWFVPHRIVWDGFEDFITGGPNGNDATVHPTIVAPGAGGFPIGSLADYLGCPTGVNSLEVSALPFRGYALIWNEWYRDQDLQAELVVNTGNGVDTTTSTALQNVAWEKDRFTMSRPSPQKGAAVSLPLGSTAPLKLNTNVSSSAATIGRSPATDPAAQMHITGNSSATLYADLTTATAATINELREAFAIQRYRENRMRYGSRYTEYLLSSFNVKSSDARLQRPEYLGGGKQVIQFSEVLQTGGTSAGAPTGVGNLTGHGIGSVRSNRYRKFFEEHGYVFSFISVLPRTMYVQGLPATWNRRIKEDYFQHELQHLGSVAIPNKEVYASHTTPNGTFGYQDRYDEYRHAVSGISGEFRSTLDFWHYGRVFGSNPALNASFVRSNPTKRVNQVTTADTLWVMTSHSIQARRCVAASGVPLGV